MADTIEEVWVLPVLIALVVLGLISSIRWYLKNERPVSSWASVSAVVGTRWVDLEEDEGLLATDSSQPEYSWYQGPKALACGRVVVFLWMLGVFVIQDATASSFFARFMFFTIWNFNLQVIFYGFLVFSSLSYLYSKQVPKWVLVTTSLLSNVCFPASFLVSLLTWGVLVPQAASAGNVAGFLTFYSWNEHLANFICLSLEFYFDRLLVQPHLFLAIYCWAALYVIFAWIFHAYTGLWAYFFLNLSPTAPLWYSGVLVAMIGAFSLYAVMSRCKEKVINRIDRQFQQYDALDKL